MNVNATATQAIGFDKKCYRRTTYFDLAVFGFNFFDGDMPVGFRFRRSVKLLPGVKLNLSKTGPSVSVGIRGAHETIGKHGIRTTIGLPGSGLSYTHLDQSNTNNLSEPNSNGFAPNLSTNKHSFPFVRALFLILIVLLLAAFSVFLFVLNHNLLF